MRLNVQHPSALSAVANEPNKLLKPNVAMSSLSSVEIPSAIGR